MPGASDSGTPGVGRVPSVRRALGPEPGRGEAGTVGLEKL